jgi:carboxymethylenebutenolidase
LTGRTVRLTARDGHSLEGFIAAPDAEPVAGLVVVQEIFGLTAHIKAVVEQYAAAGFLAVAPAFFDRVEPGTVLEYSDVETGRGTMQKLRWPDTLADVEAALEHVRRAGKVGVVGFCWGGTVAHVAAAELPLAAAVAYYGGGIARMLDKRPRCPIVYHFGGRDQAIPMAAVEQIRAAVPDGAFYVYPGAGHGFSCTDRASYSPADAELAFERSRAFLESELA